MKKSVVFCLLYLSFMIKAHALGVMVDQIDHDFGNSSGTFSGNLTNSFDWFSFDAVEGDTIAFEVTSAGFDSSIGLFQETFNGIVEVDDLIGIDLTLLALDDNGGDGLLSLLNFNIITAGQYALGIQQVPLKNTALPYDVSLIITSASLSSVPLPTTIWLIASGLLAACCIFWRK